MRIRPVRIGVLSALIGALSAPAASAESGLASPPVADVTPLVDVVVGQTAEVVAVAVDLAPAAETLEAVAAAVPLPSPVPTPIPVERAAPDPVGLEEAPAAALAPRLAERAGAPAARTAPPTTETRRPEPAAVPARLAPRGSATTAALLPRRPLPAAPTPASSPPATPVASDAAPTRCGSCLLSRVQIDLSAAAGTGFGLPFGVLTLALLFSPVLLAFRLALSTAHVPPLLAPRLERPG